MRLTRITSDSGRLTKEIALNPDGTIKKSGQTFLTKGRAQRVTVEDFASLASLFSDLEPNQAVIHGEFKHAEDQVAVVSRATREQMNGAQDVITRTTDDFFFPRHSLTLPFDYDGGDPLSRTNWFEIMCDIWPGFENAGHVHVPSSSGALRIDGKPVDGSTGMRIVFGVEDASDIPRFCRVLYQLAWLKGHGFIMVSSAGSLLERITAFDAAVYSPERLDYLAAPVLADPRLSRDGAPTVVEGALINTRLLLDLSIAQTAKFEQLVAEAKRGMTKQADRIKQEYISKKAIELDCDRSIIESRLKFRLLGSDVLKFDRGKTFTVAEILADPDEFDGETLPDPIEPERGKNKACVWFNRPQNEVRIYSNIHGGVHYVLRFDFDTLVAAYEARDDKFKFADLYNRADLSPVQQEQFRMKVREATKLSKKVISEEIDSALFTAISEELTHGQMAERWLKTRGGVVFDLGEFWTPDDRKLWVQIPIETVRKEIAEQFSDQRACRSHAQYKQVAEAAADAATQKDYFADAPRGVASPSCFLSLTDDGEVEQEELTADHRQRFMLPADPEHGSPTLFDSFLDDCFEQPKGRPAKLYNAELNKDLVQEIFGAVLFNIGGPFEIAFLFFGEGNSGKSTLMRILKMLVSDEFISAVKPHHWDDPYHAAALANSRLNIVGETGEHVLGDGFKMVVGRDDISGRNPYGRVFNFMYDGSNVFNANEFPATRYRDSAFWRRWRIVSFPNSRAEHDEDNDRNLDTRIVSHEAARILSWAVEGAKRVIAQNGFTKPKSHVSLLKEWKLEANSVAAWLNDPEQVQLEEVGCEIGDTASKCYSQYKFWAGFSGLKPLGRNKFYTECGRLGRPALRNADKRYLDGVILIEQDDNAPRGV